MRIITGKLKGRQLETPLDLSIRPTADRCKESMFNVIESRKGIHNARVLDLFAGTGNLGFEAISRGATHVTSVDSSPESARLVRAGAKWFDIENQISFIGADVDAYLEKHTPGSFDIIFADPPYDWPGIPSLPEKILDTPWLIEDGWLIIEHDARHSFVNHPRCVFAKPYGRTIVSIFPNETSE
jgi:16S rRNA (guanine966-N2)-methyltransferase